MKSYYVILLCLIALVCCSFDDKSESDEYSKTFDWVIDVISQNDAGYQSVINKKGYSNYLQFTQDIKNEIHKVNNGEDFEKQVNNWLAFFRTGHLFFFSKNETDRLDLENFGSRGRKEAISLKSLSNKTLYLRITTFDFSAKSTIDSLLIKHDSDIRNSTNLILDIRNSGGGSDRTWENLIPYLYTNPVRTFTGDYKVSEANANAYEHIASLLKSDSSFLSMAKRLREYKGDFMRRTVDGAEISVIKKNEILQKPEHIAIIINGGNASADESFLLFAKQSMKVKLFGLPTLGCYDYLNMNIVNSEDGKYVLGYAMSKTTNTKYMPLDSIGIQPDFLIDAAIAEDKWVEYVQSVLEYN